MDATLERIMELMKEKDINDAQMEKYLNIPRGTFSNWKQGKSKNFNNHIGTIADILSVSIDFLVRGEDMKTDALSHDEFELISNYRKLSSKARNHIAENIKLILGE